MSLTFNISRMLMVIINSVSVVMFPLIKNVKQNDLHKLYMKIRRGAMILLFDILVFYYPMKVILTLWLPQYSESFKYVSLLLPMCIFESKSTMLVNTYLKVLRKEAALFTVNLIIVVISVIISVTTVYLIGSLDLAILSITVLLFIKSVLLECFVEKVIPISVRKDIFNELLMAIIFIASSWYVNSWGCCIIYLIAYAIYLFVNKSYLAEIRSIVKSLVARS